MFCVAIVALQANVHAGGAGGVRDPQKMIDLRFEPSNTLTAQTLCDLKTTIQYDGKEFVTRKTMKSGNYRIDGHTISDVKEFDNMIVRQELICEGGTNIKKSETHYFDEGTHRYNLAFDMTFTRKGNTVSIEFVK